LGSTETGRAVERCEVAAHVTEIDEAVDASKQMIDRDVILYRELVEQRPAPPASTPSSPALSRASGGANQQTSHRSSGVFNMA